MNDTLYSIEYEINFANTNEQERIEYITDISHSIDTEFHTLSNVKSGSLLELYKSYRSITISPSEQSALILDVRADSTTGENTASLIIVSNTQSADIVITYIS